MFEWVKVDVTHDRVRDVFIGENRVGTTRGPFAVPEGTHTFHLGTPLDYTPERRRVVVTNTTRLNPKRIAFQLAAPRR
jgi:hypothetical protein